MPFGQIVGSTFDLIVEVTFQGASLVNTKEMAVGDMVTFDLGFDKKKNKPEAINIHKARIFHDIRCVFFEKNCAWSGWFLVIFELGCVFFGVWRGGDDWFKDDAVQVKTPCTKGIKRNIQYIYIYVYTWPPRKKTYHYMMFVPCKLVCLTTLNGMISLNLLSSEKRTSIAPPFSASMSQGPQKANQFWKYGHHFGSSSSTWIPLMGFTEIASSFRTVDHGWGQFPTHVNMMLCTEHNRIIYTNIKHCKYYFMIFHCCIPFGFQCRSSSKKRTAATRWVAAKRRVVRRRVPPKRRKVRWSVLTDRPGFGPPKKKWTNVPP